MRKLYEFFKVLQFQKIIVDETTRGAATNVHLLRLLLKDDAS